MGQESQSAVVGQFEMVASMSGRLCRMLHLSEFRAYLQEPNPLAGLRTSQRVGYPRGTGSAAVPSH